MSERLKKIDGCNGENLELFQNLLLNVSYRGGRIEVPVDSVRYGVCQNLVRADLLKASGDNFIVLTKKGKNTVSYLEEEEDLGML